MNHLVSIRTALSAATLALFAAFPAAAGAQVANGDFSHGLDGWSTAGDASARAASATGPSLLWLTTASTDYEDDLDSHLAAGARNASGVAAVAAGQPGGLEDAVGVPLHALDPDGANFVTATEGSAAAQAFAAAAGATLSFRWDLGTLDQGGDATLADVAFVVIDGHVTTLADSLAATLPGTDGNALHTGWLDFSTTFSSAGAHTIAFGITDVGDYDETSTLAVSDVRLSLGAVPEAPPLLALVAGLALVGLQRRRRVK